MAKYRRVPLKSIEEFKWHTKIIKTFGKKALILYTAFPKNGADVDDTTLNNLIADEQQRSEIMKFMVDNGLIELAEGPSKAPKAEEKKEAKKEPEEAKPEEEKAPKEKPRKPERKKEEEISISYEPSKEEEEIQPEVTEEEIEEEKPKARKAPPKEEEIEPEEKEEEIKPEIEEEAPKEKPKSRKAPPKEEEIEPEAEEEIKPDIEEETPKEEAVEEEAPKEEPVEEEKPEEQITSENEESPDEKEEKPNLTPAEMIVHDKYGELGVAIFRLIDGKRSVAEVAKESGTSQEKVMEVLKYLDEVGLISLGGGAEAKGGGAQAPAEEKFAPLSEESEFSTLSIDEQKDGVRIAKVKSSGIVNKMKMNVSIVFKYGKNGRELLDYISSKKEANVINLAIKLNIPIDKVEEIVNFLKGQGYVDISMMSRDEIKKAFGYDAYIIYKRYGKKGVIFYEVIDKDIPLKSIAELISERDALKIIEIFKLIRDVLGIELPINDDAIKRELVF